MENTKQDTHTSFAPAERALDEDIAVHNEIVRNAAHITAMLDAFPTGAAILIKERQIVYYNKKFAEVFDKCQRNSVVGMRFGEVCDCIYSRVLDDGCGTSNHCSTCGVVLAILTAQNGGGDIRECRLTVDRGGETISLDFRVYASPIEIQGNQYTIISLIDISDEKRRAVLERIFFHDIMNTANGIRSLLELYHLVDIDERNDIVDDLNIVSNQLIGEITSQRDLLDAEYNELRTSFQEISALEILRQIMETYRYHEAAMGKYITTAGANADDILVSDITLLYRVLENLVKNALEASKEGETVTIRYERLHDEKHLFSVHNPGVIPEQAQLQIFERSFSTKGRGRGIGTYSAKLLTERYLDGTIFFRSDIVGGTTFSVMLP